MPILKPISGHGSTGGIRRYLEKGGRALARTRYLRVRDAGALGEDAKEACAWDAEMDATRAAFGTDAPWRGKPARTFKHFVLSPDPATTSTWRRCASSRARGRSGTSTTTRSPSSTTTTTPAAYRTRTSSREQRQPPHRLPHADPATPRTSTETCRTWRASAGCRGSPTTGRPNLRRRRAGGQVRAGQEPQERLPGPGREGDHALGRLLVGRRHPRPRRARQDHGARRGGVLRHPRRPGVPRRRQLGQGAAGRLGVQPGGGTVQEGNRRAPGFVYGKEMLAPALRARRRLPPHGRERRADPRGRRARPSELNDLSELSRLSSALETCAKFDVESIEEFGLRMATLERRGQAGGEGYRRLEAARAYMAENGLMPLKTRYGDGERARRCQRQFRASATERTSNSASSPRAAAGPAGPAQGEGPEMMVRG